MIGGFHSPMERECLALLLRGTQPVVVCPARGIENIRLPAAWKQPLAEGRLLILSPFERKHRRATAGLAVMRNRLVAALAEQVFVAHAGTGSKTGQLCRELLAKGQTLWTLASGENNELVGLGAKPVVANGLAGLQQL